MRTYLFAAVLLSLPLLGGCKKKLTLDDIDLGLSGAFFDDFNRADEALTDTAQWLAVVDSGSSVVVSNQKARAMSAGGNLAAGFNQTALTLSDFTLTTKYSVSGGDLGTNHEAIVLVTDAPNIFPVERYRCGIIANTLILSDDSGASEQGVATHSMTDGTEGRITASRTGNTVSCTHTGTVNETISITDSSPFTAQHFAFVGYNSDFIYFDDFVVLDGEAR